MLDRTEIQRVLPHRPPFLFVDSIPSIVPGERITGEFLVKETEPFLSRRGNEAYFPETLLTEAMAQVGAILVLYPEENRGKTIYFRSIEETQFTRRVEVGSRIRVEAAIRKMRSRYGSLAVEAFVDGRLVATGVMSFALG
ncbi:MAG TPA: 3-hydroxyacyl-[acyl-carrier-protein] dehydratase FabZ [Vicinamibacteria bacterium]|nr:3-hydroxyacyl-[acyl-carrier-protein] dehydratase FabZ [Vicinamibacteria bacterium]